MSDILEELFEDYSRSVCVWHLEDSEHNYLVARANYSAFIEVYFNQQEVH